VRTLIRFLTWIAVIVGLMIGAARLVAIRWLTLPTNDPVLEASVLPSLHGGDMILALRLTTPRLGDLILCPEPGTPERYVIGRLMGEPGDSVRIENGVPYLNGRPFTTERSCDPQIFTYPSPNDASQEVKQQCDYEAIGTHLHMMGHIGTHKVAPEAVAFEVTDGKVFLLSDNRLFPYDSRDFGLVDFETCKETIVARLVSRRGWMDSENRLDYIQ
jgi:signal peptidase I